MMTKDREYRFFEVRTMQAEPEKEDYRIEGYAVVFNQATCLYEWEGVKYYEIIDRNALDGAKLDDVVLNFNHGGKPVARTRNKTLELTIDDHGLKVSAYLGGTDEGRRMYEEIKGGYLDKMSFCFVVEADEYDRGTHTDTITKIARLYDVSVVDFPAYDSTSVNARSQELFKAEALKERAEARNAKVQALRNKIAKSELERKLKQYE